MPPDGGAGTAFLDILAPSLSSVDEAEVVSELKVVAQQVRHHFD